MPHHPKKAKAGSKLTETRSESLIRKARKRGARFRPTAVNLQTLERKKVSWLSMNILRGLGVPAKPKPGSICPSCMSPGTSFELDHMGPWRVYVAALAGPHIAKNGTISLQHVRMLYNDPENLWWICKKCNGRKSDYISEDGSVPMSGVKGRNVSVQTMIA